MTDEEHADWVARGRPLKKMRAPDFFCCRRKVADFPEEQRIAAAREFEEVILPKLMQKWEKINEPA